MIAADVLRLVWNHPANRGRRLRTLCRAAAWQINKRLTKRPWEIRVYDQYRMKCYPDSFGASIMVYTNGRQDHDDFAFIETYLRPGDRFLDVGANIGIYTLLAAKCVGQTGRVEAFEAGQRAYERLVENVRLNQLPHVRVHRAAISDNREPVRFLQTHDLTNRLAIEGVDAATATEEVPAVTLDDVLDQTRFAMAKIDVEGAEPICFRGAAKSLAAGNPPVWFIELKDRLLRRFGFTAEQFVQFLSDNGYDLGIYEHGRRGLYFPDPWVGEAENAVAVHRDYRTFVHQRLQAADASRSDHSPDREA